MMGTRSRARTALFQTPMPATPKKKRSSPPTSQTVSLSSLDDVTEGLFETPTSKKPRRSSSASPMSVLRSEQVAAVNSKQAYQDLDVSPAELRPSATLTTGQCFHWKALEQDNAVPIPNASAWGSHNATEWVGVLRTTKTSASIVVALQETPDTTLFRALYAPETVNVKKELQNYFQLGIPLQPLYEKWSNADPKRLARIAECLPGVRIIEQDPWECLVSFICSSNNNIPRITKMLSAIRQTYGTHLLTIGDESFYSFPSFQTLRREATDTALRDIGLGYRAKYIIETMETLESLGGESYLAGLRNINDPTHVQDQLIQFCGVGRKVADCVALFSLRQPNAIPVDVHVWNIACRDYDEEGNLTAVKSLTPTIYRRVGDLFRNRFVQRAGWAHSLLFVAELPSFRPVLPEDLIAEMDNFREEERQRKEAAKAAKTKRNG